MASIRKCPTSGGGDRQPISRPVKLAGSPFPISTVGSSRVSKMTLKEKIIQMYDVLLKGEDPLNVSPLTPLGSVESNDKRFWSEFFLLKPKISVLEVEIAKASPEALLSDPVRGNLNRLFAECILTLGDDHHIRVVYSLQTLCGLCRSILNKDLSSNQKSCSYDQIYLLVDFNKAERMFQMLFESINTFLLGEEPASLKNLCLKILLVLSSGINNLSQNLLLDYFMNNGVFESLVHLLSNTDSRIAHGEYTVLLITVLVQYKKYEAANPYIVKLSILDQELALHGYAQVITTSLLSYTQSFETSISDQTSSNWITSLTSMVGSMFLSDEETLRNEQMKARTSYLLAFYEAVHLNRNFITTLANYQTSSPTSDLLQETSVTTNNLFVAFLEYCSVVMQDIKTLSSQITLKLSFSILLCITEDQFGNALMHDQNLVFRIKLRKVSRRHKKPVDHARNASFGSKTLACAVLYLMSEFLRSHLMKRLPLELYTQALAIIHRLLSYQKRSRVRISYPWKELWTSLFSLLKFLISNETSLSKRMNIFGLAFQVTTIFNMFITYGDTFLPSPTAYDELFYEMVRCHQTFDLLNTLALKYSTTGGEYKEAATRLTNSLLNIQAISSHFIPKIEAWLAQQQLSTPTEDQILEVVQRNYDSLTLKLQDGLDQYDAYSEYPQNSAFFKSLVRQLMADIRQNVVLNDFELQTILQEFSTIQ